jgi:hypothetical protein
MITPDQVQAAAFAPKATTIDGNSATGPDAAGIITLSNYAAALSAIPLAKPSIRMFKLIPPGAVPGWSGSRQVWC